MINIKLINIRIALVAVILLMILIPEFVWAQETQNNIIDDFQDRFSDQTQQWRSNLLAVARGLFFGLVVIEWVITFGFITLNGGGLNDIAAATIRSILFIGFGLVLLANPAWISAIVQGFVDSGSIAINGVKGGTTGVNASNMFDMGLSTAKTIFANAGGWNVKNTILYTFIAGAVIILFSLISAIMLVAIIEMFIVLSAGVVLLGFMATRFTKDIGLKYINYAVSMGIKLFMIQIIAGLTAGLVKTYIDEVGRKGGFGLAEGLTLIAIGIVAVHLIKQIPDYAQSLMSGVSVGSLPNVGTATQAATSAVGNAVKVAAAVKTGGASLAAGAGAARGAIGKLGAGKSVASKGPPTPSASSKGGSSKAGSSRMASIAGSAGKSTNATSSSSSLSSSPGSASSGQPSSKSMSPSPAVNSSSGKQSTTNSGQKSGSKLAVAGGTASSGTTDAPSGVESGLSSSTPSITMNSEGEPGGDKSSAMTPSDSTENIPSVPTSVSTGNVSPIMTSSSVDDSSSSKSSTQMKDQSSDDIARMKNQSQKDKVTSLKQKLNKRDSGSKV